MKGYEYEATNKGATGVFVHIDWSRLADARRLGWSIHLRRFDDGWMVGKKGHEYVSKCTGSIGTQGTSCT
jgi:hypothetical protein